MKTAALVLFVIGATLAAILAVAHAPDTICMIARFFALAGIILYAWQSKSLTPWIVAAMFVGAEVGHDFPVKEYPNVAPSLKVLSTIFLRLIKTIIGPLVFDTLLVGMAGHANLKQIGRMGIKALVYFEVVT